ncbi:MAG: phage head closure protein [Sulfitobacter sp.]
MSAPRLNRQLLLEAPQRVSDGAGGYTEGWSALGTLWAEVTLRTGRETAQIGAPISQARFRIVVRGAPPGSPARPTAQQRFREAARIYAIEAVAEKDPEGRFLVCYAQEETPL